jgi:hypothetical protein
VLAGTMLAEVDAVGGEAVVRARGITVRAALE